MTDFWRFQAHPEVWLLVAAVVCAYLYVTRVIAPKALPAGQSALTRGQRGWFAGGVLTLWVASDWPMHDIAEEYLYAAHMTQHLMLSLVMPAMFLLATPRWLARLVVPEGSRAARFMRRAANPVVAGLVFNLVVALTHWPAMVNFSVESGPLHYGVHVLVVTTALLMWLPVCGPLPELRISLPGQMLYLFLMSIIPTVPAAWLTFAEGTVYSAYDIPERLWGISVASDQQAAGVIMKVLGGTYLWVLIAVTFFRWAHRHEQAERRGRTLTEREVLTYEDVAEAFDGAGPAPRERTPR